MLAQIEPNQPYTDLGVSWVPILSCFPMEVRLNTAINLDNSHDIWATHRDYNKHKLIGLWGYTGLKRAKIGVLGSSWGVLVPNKAPRFR